MKDEVSLIGASDVELKPRAVVAPLTPNTKLRPDEDEADTEELDEVGVVVLALVELDEVEIELLDVVSTELEEELVVGVVVLE